MLTAIEGIYKDGLVHLNKRPAGIENARVVVTFLTTSVSPLEQVKIQFGQFPADEAYNEEDFADAEWRGEHLPH